jgi:hypothetical protein
MITIKLIFFFFFIIQKLPLPLPQLQGQHVSCKNGFKNGFKNEQKLFLPAFSQQFFNICKVNVFGNCHPDILCEIGQETHPDRKFVNYEISCFVT